jgi:hypothetical protein
MEIGEVGRFLVRPVRARAAAASWVAVGIVGRVGAQVKRKEQNLQFHLSSSAFGSFQDISATWICLPLLLALPLLPLFCLARYQNYFSMLYLSTGVGAHAVSTWSLP